MWFFYLYDSFKIIFMTHWLVTGKTAPLPLTHHTEPVWQRTMWLWLPAWAPFHQNTPVPAVCLESLKFSLENRMWPNAQGQKWPYRCDVMCCSCTESLCSVFNALLTHRNAKPEKKHMELWDIMGPHHMLTVALQWPPCSRSQTSSCNREWTCTQVGMALVLCKTFRQVWKNVIK